MYELIIKCAVSTPPPPPKKKKEIQNDKQLSTNKCTKTEFMKIVCLERSITRGSSPSLDLFREILLLSAFFSTNRSFCQYILFDLVCEAAAS